MPLHHIHTETEFAYGVWHINESNKDLRSALCEQDNKALENIKNESRANESAASRIILDEICRKRSFKYEGLRKDEFGAPFLSNFDQHISISHTKGYAAGIIHGTLPVGIDIELLDDRISKMVHRVLSEEEMHMIDGDADKAVVLWSMKETLYKIYRKRQVTFATDLRIDDFEMHQEGVATGEINTGGATKRCTLYYELMDGLAITYGF